MEALELGLGLLFERSAASRQAMPSQFATHVSLACSAATVAGSSRIRLGERTLPAPAHAVSVAPMRSARRTAATGVEVLAGARPRASGALLGLGLDLLARGRAPSLVAGAAATDHHATSASLCVQRVSLRALGRSTSASESAWDRRSMTAPSNLEAERTFSVHGSHVVGVDARAVGVTVNRGASAVRREGSS